MNPKKGILEKLLGQGKCYINPWGKRCIRWPKLIKDKAFKILMEAGWRKTKEFNLTYYTNGIQKVLDKPNINFIDTYI